MGIDSSYQAMPETCNLLARARQEPEIGSHLEFFSSYANTSEANWYTKESAADTPPTWVEFIKLLRQTVEQYPGIEHRDLDLERLWDRLHYLLSAERRLLGNYYERDPSYWIEREQNRFQWIEKAIRGGAVLNEKAKTVIGSPIRYLEPIEVLVVSDLLNSITIDMLYEHWNPPRMRKARVYKTGGFESDDEFRLTAEYFGQMQAFYTSAANHEEGVLSFFR